MKGKKGKKKVIIGIATVGGFILALFIAIRRKAKAARTSSENNAFVPVAGEGIYEAIGKFCMDKVISFIGLVLLSPIFLLISLAVYFDNPGPIFFTQKRIGKDKQFFCLHKFRTMKMETPHDIPTHQLKNPEQYITRVGRLLRRTSLDELPQLWDIFRGKMSIVGPRPALWNQDDLIAERDKYGANGIKPGLTGWAQINGRDELAIPDKARLDGEYVRHLKQGGLRALFFDVRCIAGTVINVLDGDGVVEGGTGSMDSGKNGSRNEENAGLEDYAYKKKFVIDTSTANRKRVLITGKGNYIGDSFAAYAEEHYGENFTVDTADTAESINRTGGAECTEKPLVLILVNHDVAIYNFRMELVERLLSEGYEVHISSPRGEHTEELIALGAHFHEAVIDRHGMNPAKELRLLMEYRRLIRRIHPAVVLTYTVKPNVYGGIASREASIPYIVNITGLGTAVNGGGVSEKLILLLYRFGLKGARKVFFQNEENKDYMVDRHIISGSYAVLPGSGVNLKTHIFEYYPEDTDRIVFITVGRIMRDKGTDELLEAADIIKQKYPSVTFRLIGFFDDDYETKIRDAEKKGVIEYIEQQKDIHPWMRDAHAIIHPSYHEGMSNVLLEAAATGRPVLTSDIPGCRETFDEGISGFGFKPQDVDSLVKTIERFICIPYEQKVAMGKNGRRKVEREFNRDIVVEKYMNEIQNIRRV